MVATFVGSCSPVDFSACQELTRRFSPASSRLMGIRSYFQGGRLARMSDGSYCIIRDLGLVKGGKGLKCHRTLLRLTPKGIISKIVEAIIPERWAAAALRPSLNHSLAASTAQQTDRAPKSPDRSLSEIPARP
jgi:hypothetical protein